MSGQDIARSVPNLTSTGSVDVDDPSFFLGSNPQTRVLQAGEHADDPDSKHTLVKFGAAHRDSG